MAILNVLLVHLRYLFGVVKGWTCHICNYIAESRSKTVTKIVEWKALTERVMQAAQQLFEMADLPLTQDGARDPRVIAMALLARTVGNLEGALDMIEEGKIVEARTLMRCCWENLFWAAALAKKGKDFVEQVVSDDALTRMRRGKRLLNWSREQREPLQFEEKLADFLTNYAEQNPDVAAIQHAAAAEAGNVKGGYIIYGELSGDAAHPSAGSLSRHVEWIGAEGTLTMRARPVAEDDEVEQTLEFGCSAMLGVLTGANQVVGYPMNLNALAEAFMSLSNRSKSKT